MRFKVAVVSSSAICPTTMLRLSPSREAVGGSENSANVCVLFYIITEVSDLIRAAESSCKANAIKLA